MAIKESPLAKVKRLHGTKESLVDTVVADLARETGEDAGELKQRLLGSSNQQLLRLAEVLKTVKDKYGSKDKLVDALSAARGKAKDGDYMAKLRTLPLPRLLDMMRAAS